MVGNLRQKQADALVRMLHFNTLPSSSNRPDDETFKVLILDRYTKDVLAPLLRVNDLRKHGVTLHLMIEADRQPIPDVPAVYFVTESDANVDRIAADAREGLYDTLYVNFVGHISVPLLDRFASVTARDASAQRVTQVYDKYLSFISLESSLFSLGLHNTYVTLNDPRMTDQKIEAEVNRVVEGLFSVLATAGMVPIIRCPKGGAAEHVAHKLNDRLRTHLAQRNNLFSEVPTGLSASLTRPLLCLFDRNFELSVILQHSWTYKPMVHDVLGMSLNRITLVESGGAGGPGSPRAGGAGGGGKKSYEVGDSDAFWGQHGRKQFPKVAEEVENLVASYKQTAESFNQQAAGHDALIDPDEADQASTRNLMAAVSSLPELTEKKRIMDKHTELATALLGHIKARGLDQFYNTEEDLLGGKGTVATIKQVLTAQRGTSMDKLRLVLVFLLTCEELPNDTELQQLESTLSALGADMHAFGYVLRMRKMKLTGQKPVPASQSYAEGLGALSSQSNNLLNWADKTFGQGLSSLTKGVKNLLAGEQQAAVTVAVEQLMGGAATPDKDDMFAYFDPKARGGNRQPGPFKEAIVFMVGGGNYLEYESLVTWAQRSQPPKSVMYGATELLNGEAFVQQLTELGSHSMR